MGEDPSSAGMSAFSFTPNPNFEAEIAADPESKAVLLERANTALAAAQNAAPVLTGKYRASLFADEDGLGSTSSFWALIEYGSINDSPSAPLRTGVEVAGVEWSDP
jgi:hypothetical protein